MLALAATSLVIAATPAHGPTRRWTLACAPARGTLPKPGMACARLARLESPFAPVPPKKACSQIYGGPEVARVTGRFRGRSVHAVFRRRDGCEIERWNNVRFLFPIPLSGP
jgi:hypothetical protein